jgi:hypothetical protein
MDEKDVEKTWNETGQGKDVNPPETKVSHKKTE